MSRNSWSSTGSDAEVRHHFDQPFDYDPRNHHGESAHRMAQSESEEDANDDSNYSDNETDAASLSESHDSFAAASEYPASEQTTPLPPQSDYIDDAQDQSNQAICRICLESASSDLSGGESLGRLLSPCRCKGTMKYVHATCLDQWRAASARSSSAVACDQCGAPYRFRKSKFVGLATSPTLLFVVSLFLFLLLIWTVGVIATFCMDLYDKPASIKSRYASPKSKSSKWWPWRSSDNDMDEEILPLQTDAWSYLDVDYTTPGMWSYGTLMYEPAAYIKLIKEAVRSFASGEAVDAVREVVGLQDSEEVQQTIQDEPKEEQGFWSALKYEWMYGDGGLWKKSASSALPTTAQTSQGTSASTSSNSDIRDAKPAIKKSRKPYDARAASDAKDINAIKRRRKKAAKSARHSAATQDESQGFLGKLLVQFSVGFSLVGILSFVNLLVGASFLGPINLNVGLGRSFARMTSGGRGRNGQQEGVNIASILIVLLVIVGVVRALHIVYKLVRKGARRGLSRLEAVIVDWNGDDDDGADAAAEDVVIATNDRFGREAEHVQRAFVQGQGD
ncbi:uncharacterized protein UTRI_00303_B [Ustilago trichophora]|uniref:RING-CH-type domain-containing protein n=1 Tax=Ustilago trichophora TaxID=86804 RepID=A0A5C3DNY4_9BASI|nr:uncharacterized protein UTRI_00303_B [Ustilago trichophora]